MKSANRQSKMANLKGLVIAVVVLLGITTSFFTAMTVYEQLNIHWIVDIAIAGAAGIATALFQASLIGFSRFIRGVPAVKVIMFAAALFLTSLTIMGVYSAMQSSFFRNVVDSGNYQRLSRQSKSLQKKLDRQIELNHITKSKETAEALERTNRALENAEKSGSGAAQNQWATNLSGVMGVDPGAVSFGRHTVIGLAIDLCYYLALWFLFYGLLFREKTPMLAVLPIEEEYLDYDEDYRQWNRKKEKQKEIPEGIPSETPIPVIAKRQGDNGVKHTPPAQRPRQNREITNAVSENYIDDEPEKPSFKIPAGFQKSTGRPKLNSDAGIAKIKANKEKRKRELLKYYEKHPGASKTEAMKAVGISLNTLNQYLDEIAASNPQNQSGFDGFDGRKTDSGFEDNKPPSKPKNQDIFLDSKSGLLWQYSGSPEMVNFENARKYVADLNRDVYAGYADWRLPTLEELETINFSDHNPEQNWLWSSTKKDDHHIWARNMENKTSYFHYWNDRFFVKAVRG